MPKSLSTNMYGADETSFASSISSDALDPSGATEDFWGATFDQSMRSKSNGPQDPGDSKKISDKPDARAKTKGNH